MKTTLNFLTALLIAMGIAISFSQCQDDLVPAEILPPPNASLNGYNSGYTVNGTINGNRVNGNMVTADVCACLTNNFDMEELNAAEKDALIFMREEEKLARDVYSYFYDKWEYNVFNNIRRAEDKHMDAMLCLTERYGLTDPVGDNEPGKFINTQFAELYDNFIDKGDESLAAALAVGATIEDLDISDLVRLTDGGAIDNADILAAFGELTKGSRNHLRAFVKSMNVYGDSYTPQFITEDYFTEIINTNRERGSSICPGLINCPNYGTGNQGVCEGNGSGDCPGDCTGIGPENKHNKKGGRN